MSGIILPNSMPNLVGDHEKQQWLEGKANRAFVMNEITQVYEDMEAVGEELKRSSVAFSQLFTLQKMLGLQLDTLVRMLDKAVPDFKENFQNEYKVTTSYAMFIDSLNNDGQHSNKPLREKIDIVRNWNANKDNLKVKGLYFGLHDFIITHPKEFTEDEVEMLAIEFDTPHTVEAHKAELAKLEKPVEEPNVS